MKTVLKDELINSKAGYTAQVVCRLCFCPPKKEVMDERTDGQMDGRTNGQTHPLIESRLTTKNQYFKNTKKIRIFKKVRFILGDFRSNFFHFCVCHANIFFATMVYQKM